MLEKIIWKTLQDTHTGNGFQNRFSITQDKIARIDKRGSMELKSICKAKEMMAGVKETYGLKMGERRIFLKTILDVWCAAKVSSSWLLPPYVSWGSNSGGQAWEQIPSPLTEPWEIVLKCTFQLEKL